MIKCFLRNKQTVNKNARMRAVEAEGYLEFNIFKTEFLK